MSDETHASKAPGQRPPHAATVVQRKAPHPATVPAIQPKTPHAATVVQPKAPHPATVVQPKAAHTAAIQRKPTPETEAREAPTQAGGSVRVAQCRKPLADIFNFVDQNGNQLGTTTGGIGIRRLLVWNDKGWFDENGSFNVKRVKKALSTRTPNETQQVNENALPAFMKVREEFSIKLPDFFGGGRLSFRKNPESVVFQRRGWISDNIYWRSPNVPRVRYMIHSILEWAGDVGERDEPTPHITLRNAETQAKIDLDTFSPLPDQETRITGELEVTKSSFSQGLGVNRTPGANMLRDDPTFNNVKSQAVQDWLGKLVEAAQYALIIP